MRLAATRPASWVYFLFGVALRYEASKYSIDFLGTFYFNVDRSYCLQSDIALQTKIIVTQKICLSMPYYQNCIVTYHHRTQRQE